ncbi:MAG: DUF2384 domain-containing protein [Gammaproteobacteria bacterium]
MTEINPAERNDLIDTLIWVMRGWGLDNKEQVRLLGFPDGTPARSLQQYRQGKAMPNETVFLQHAELILAIYRAISSFFPGNSTMANYWVTTPSAPFGGRAPLEIMLADGLEGMRYCLDHLNGEHW